MQLFDVQMHTPLGDRYGQLRAQVQDGKLRGELSLLGKTQPIDGTVSEDGLWEFRGKLITLLNSIDYYATGRKAGDTLQLVLQGNRHTYVVTGILREETE